MKTLNEIIADTTRINDDNAFVMTYDEFTATGLNYNDLDDKLTVLGAIQEKYENVEGLYLTA